MVTIFLCDSGCVAMESRLAFSQIRDGRNSITADNENRNDTAVKAIYSHSNNAPPWKMHNPQK
jgi:hypothetical protein